MRDCNVRRETLREAGKRTEAARSLENRKRLWHEKEEESGLKGLRLLDHLKTGRDCDTRKRKRVGWKDWGCWLFWGGLFPCCGERTGKTHQTVSAHSKHWDCVMYIANIETMSAHIKHWDCVCTHQTPNTLEKIPKRNMKSWGEHFFSFTAPSVWNSLPSSLWNLPEFKTQLNFPF